MKYTKDIGTVLTQMLIIVCIYHIYLNLLKLILTNLLPNANFNYTYYVTLCSLLIKSRSQSDLNSHNNYNINYDKKVYTFCEFKQFSKLKITYD